MFQMHYRPLQTQLLLILPQHIFPFPINVLFPVDAASCCLGACSYRCPAASCRPAACGGPAAQEEGSRRATWLLVVLTGVRFRKQGQLRMCSLQFSDSVSTAKTNGVFTAWLAVLCTAAQAAAWVRFVQLCDCTRAEQTLGAWSSAKLASLCPRGFALRCWAAALAGRL